MCCVVAVRPRGATGNGSCRRQGCVLRSGGGRRRARVVNMVCRRPEGIAECSGDGDGKEELGQSAALMTPEDRTRELPGPIDTLPKLGGAIAPLHGG